MESSDKNFIYRQIILSHYQNPENKYKFDTKLTKRHNSESCIDDITFYIKVNKKTNVIEKISFDGIACAICTSSCDIICNLLKNKNIDNAKNILINYYNMIFQNKYDKVVLKEANAFEFIYLQPNRINCATLGPNLINEILNLNIKKNN
ncbi:iron-sulfur cluster assembly scaffold protein [symbiont of Argiope bruennichi]|uniref:iron-sulfur cluster assembly scaffold protein n=1 Tax=symbiont of Argiope bruennichi TaxID=2810479 RepID=UPI003DA28DA0